MINNNYVLRSSVPLEEAASLIPSEDIPIIREVIDVNEAAIDVYKREVSNLTTKIKHENVSYEISVWLGGFSVYRFTRTHDGYMFKAAINEIRRRYRKQTHLEAEAILLHSFPSNNETKTHHYFKDKPVVTTTTPFSPYVQHRYGWNKQK